METRNAMHTKRHPGYAAVSLVWTCLMLLGAGSTGCATKRLKWLEWSTFSGYFGCPTDKVRYQEDDRWVGCGLEASLRCLDRGDESGRVFELSGCGGGGQGSLRVGDGSVPVPDKLGHTLRSVASLPGGTATVDPARCGCRGPAPTIPSWADTTTGRRPSCRTPTTQGAGQRTVALRVQLSDDGACPGSDRAD